MEGPGRATFVTSLACTNPDCSATFEAHAVTIDHGLASCGFCGCSLMDISSTTRVSGESLADHGEETQVIVTSRPHAAAARRERTGTSVGVVVEARMTNTPPQTWTFTIAALAVSEWGFTHQEAMDKLLIAVRASVRDALADAQEPRPKRELALRLQLADSAGRLEQVLNDALVLDDERADRLVREHEPEQGDPGARG